MTWTGVLHTYGKTPHEVPSILRTRCRIESLAASYGCSLEGISSTAGTGAENLASTGRISLAICGGHSPRREWSSTHETRWRPSPDRGSQQSRQARQDGRKTKRREDSSQSKRPRPRPKRKHPTTETTASVRQHGRTTGVDREDGRRPPRHQRHHATGKTHGRRQPGRAAPPPGDHVRIG